LPRRGVEEPEILTISFQMKPEHLAGQSAIHLGDAHVLAVLQTITFSEGFRYSS